MGLWWTTMEGEQAGLEAHLSMRSISSDALDALLGCWGPILLHARSAFAVLHYAYKWATDIRDQGRATWNVFVWDELLTLVVWCPMLFTDLRAEVVPELACTDASRSRSATGASAGHVAICRHSRGVFVD